MEGAATALVAYAGGTPAERADRWAALPDDARRRQAAAAAARHDVDALIALLEAWLVLHGRKGAHVSPRTLESYRRAARGLLADWRQENLLHPARLAGARWVRNLEARGYQPATVIGFLAGARSLYAALRVSGATDADPFRDVHPAPNRTPRHLRGKRYKDDVVQRLLRAAVRARHRDACLIVALGAFGGLRASEMVMLRWEDVRLAEDELTVRHGKGGKVRRVAIGASLRTVLAAAWQSSGYVLMLANEKSTKPEGNPGPAKRRLRAWQRVLRLCEEAGVEAKGLHALRHAAGTRLYAETGDIALVAEFLGHESVETSRIYVEMASDRVKQAVADW
jgi:integrase/recombinase XerC